MNEQFDNQENPTVLIKTPGNILNNKFLIYPVILLTGIFIGFFLFSIFAVGKPAIPSSPLSKQPVKSSSSSAQPTIQSNSPISTILLNNPAVYEWRGSVAGKLVQVNQDSFVLQGANGNNITIFYQTPSIGRWKTIFLNGEGKDQKTVSINTITIGSSLRGDFFIFKGSPNTPVGNSFNIIK